MGEWSHFGPQSTYRFRMFVSSLAPVSLYGGIVPHRGLLRTESTRWSYTPVGGSRKAFCIFRTAAGILVSGIDSLFRSQPNALKNSWTFFDCLLLSKRNCGAAVGVGNGRVLGMREVTCAET